MAQRIFISGASGLIGGNCLSYFQEKDHEVVGSHFSFPTDRTVPFNTLQRNNASNFDIKSFNPDVIVHCGALTWVDYCEENPQESYEKTVRSTQNLLEIAEELNAKLVYLSTDYVFDGKQGPYAELSSTNPLSVYGQHKLEAEKYVMAKSQNHLILRVTNVYGDEIRNKNFIARIIDQVKQEQEIQLKLPYDQFATPVNALDVARAMHLLIRDSKKGIYHIASSDYMNRVQLALRVLKYFPDASFELTPMKTDEMKQAANRPLLGGLISQRFLAEYADFQFSNVDDYLSSKITEDI